MGIVTLAMPLSVTVKREEVVGEVCLTDWEVNCYCKSKGFKE